MFILINWYPYWKYLLIYIAQGPGQDHDSSLLVHQLQLNNMERKTIISNIQK